MDVIVKLLHRADSLNKTEHQNFFLELDESIRLHYRDLQIEMNRKEFETIVRAFQLQSAELMKIMEKTNYQDGPSPDVVRENVKIWTESQLDPEPAYHPRQASLEECPDGYHLRYRNYTILLDHQGIYALKRALKTTDADIPYASTMEDVLELMKVNGIDYDLSEEDGPKIRGNTAHRIIVDEHQAAKVRRILTGIGMEGKLTKNSQVYSMDSLAIELVLMDSESKDGGPPPMEAGAA